MQRPIACDRRRFVQIMGSTLLFSAFADRLSWATSQSSAKFAYIGTAENIHAYAIATDGRFIPQQTMASPYPVAMAIGKDNLYVVNGISDYGNLPRGSVEAYAIASNGHLKLQSRVPLSLSATAPRDLTISPDGRTLVVAVHGGGAYNVLPIHADGGLGRVSGILKETGSGPHVSQTSAQPSAVMFDRVGRVLAADRGSDRLSVLSLDNGSLSVTSRCEVNAGSGPGSLLLHPNGRQLYAAHALSGSISSFGYDATKGRILDRRQDVKASAATARAALAVHPSGEMLYSTHGDGVQVWKIDADGCLQLFSAVEDISPNRLHVTSDGTSLFVLTGDALLRMQLDAVHAPIAPIDVASVSNPLSFVSL